MRRGYSRLTRIEEKRNLRRAIIYGVSTVALMAILVVFGLPAVAKFAGLLTNIKSSSSPVEKNDITPPAPPQFELASEYTNRDRVDIKGTGEPGATIIIDANGKKDEVLADSDGLFNYTFVLNKGENTVFATAKDAEGNESQSSNVYTITFDDQPPSVEVSSPEDGANFYGSKQRQILVEGKTTDATELTINGRIVVIESDGSFSYAVSLQEGDNNFEVVAKDLAGNTQTSRLTVHFWR